MRTRMKASLMKAQRVPLGLFIHHSIDLFFSNHDIIGTSWLLYSQQSVVRWFHQYPEGNEEESEISSEEAASRDHCECHGSCILGEEG